MMNLTDCQHGGPRAPVEIPLQCSCSKTGIGNAPGTMCALCGFNFRKDPGWGPNGQMEAAFRERHISSGEHARRLAEGRSVDVAGRERAPRENVAANSKTEVEAKRRAEAGKREQEEKELLERAGAERRRTEIDAALLSGKDPDLIPYSVRGTSVAQVRARQIELARLKENRGKPWAELALDSEILRLVQAGVDRPTIVHQLGVGAHRVARVRRDNGLKSHRFKRMVSEAKSEQVSPPLPNSGTGRDRPIPEDDRPRRPTEKGERDEFRDPTHPDGAENDWAWSDGDDEDPKRQTSAPE